MHIIATILFLGAVVYCEPPEAAELPEGAKECAPDMFKFVGCLKQKVKLAVAGKDEKIAEMKSKAEKCFTDAGCEPPKFDESPKFPEGVDPDILIALLKDTFSGFDDAQKSCLANNVFSAATKQVEKCVGPHMPIDLLQSMIGSIEKAAKENSFAEELGSFARMFKAHFAAIGKAQGNCPNKNQLHACWQGVMSEMMLKKCQTVEGCKADMSDTCKSRLTDVQENICGCAVDQMSQLAGVANKIAQVQELLGQCNVDIGDLIKTAKAKVTQIRQKIQQECSKSAEPIYRCLLTRMEPLKQLMKGTISQVVGAPYGWKMNKKMMCSCAFVPPPPSVAHW